MSTFKPQKRISRHNSRDSRYKHLYPIRKSNSRQNIRRIPLPDEHGMAPYHMTNELRRLCKMDTTYSSTKFCKRMFSGCTNPYCPFAHSRATARWTPEYAEEDVVFKKPHGSLGVPRFIVNLDDESESDSEESERPSLSLRQLDGINKRWKPVYHQLAHDLRMQKLRSEYKKQFGEKDMEISDTEEDLVSSLNLMNLCDDEDMDLGE